MMKHRKMIVGGILLVLCAAVPFVLFPKYAFGSHDYMEVMVTFSMILDWRLFSVPLDAVVGWCYLLSFVLAAVQAVLGILLCFGKCGRIRWAFPILWVFYAVAVSANLTLALHHAMNPTVFFKLYILSEVLNLVILTVAFWRVRRPAAR